MWDSFERAGGIGSLTADPIGFGKGFVDQIGQHYTGYSFLSGGGMNTAYLFNTYGGLIAGYAGHMIANKLGVNRYMKKIPMVGKWVQL
jgi:hypothetical protein